ncbi:hypothetical protein FKW77_001613 [Venturia effusa]|uniref:C2H2-type domain-containing protein n=1 Tax=Venturia effusa TaxID=50376 RepID=A0A517LPK7_9PEZI|nr:hypothetical protein FKW77_001613 [Venturia effusa]
MSKRARSQSVSSSPDVDMDSDNSSEALTPSASTPSACTDPDHPVKYAHYDGPASVQATVIRCALPPHKPIKFLRYDAYEIHYQKFHSNRCLDCNRNFPSEHYLSLHIADNHNPLHDILRERGDATYSCFAEGCDYKFKNQHKRRMHAIDKHGFPKFFDFFIVNTGIDKRTSMLRPKPHGRKKPRATNQSEASASMEVEKGEVLSHQGSFSADTASPEVEKEQLSSHQGSVCSGKDDDMEDISSHQGSVSADKNNDMEDISSLTAKMSALNFVPRGVRFGKSQRGGFKR